MKVALTLAALITGVAVSGCFNGGSGAGGDAIDQSNVCRFDSSDNAKQCKDGQLAFFQPTSFGNEQLPLLVVASYCDFNRPVVYNTGGVVCVFTTQRLKTINSK